MRRGAIFRRCTKCKRRLPRGARACVCGHDRATWCYVVDLAPAGAPREQIMRAGFATGEAAMAAMVDAQRRKAEGTYVEPTRETLGQYLTRWHQGLTLREEVRPNTRDEWASHIRNHLIPRLGHIRLQQLTLAHIRACYGDLRESGHRRHGGGLSAKSVWNIQRCLHRALADAVRDGLIHANPAAGAVRRPERGEIGFWTSAQLGQFLDWIDQQAVPHDQAFYRLAAQTGMRRGELLGLRWMDVDLTAPRVTVVQQITRPRGEASTPKTRAGRRSIALSPGVADALKAHRDAQAFQRRAWAEAYEDLGLVFCRENGTAHDPRVVTHRFERHIAQAGVKRIRFHDLRHTSAVIGMREQGEWPDEVSRRLGHTSVAFTLDTYNHLLPERGHEVAAAFDRVLERRRLERRREVRSDGG